MKAYDIYKRACALMFEREGEDTAFTDKFPELLSALIAESLPYENSVREAEGRARLTTPQTVNGTEDEIDMCDAICAIALPYGVAAHFCRDDGENYQSLMYREQFVSALHEAARCCFRDVTDVYGGEEI